MLGTTEQRAVQHVLLRDPHKPAIRLFNVPVDAFEAEEEALQEEEGWGESPAGGAAEEA